MFFLKIKCIIDAEDNKNINIYRNIVNKLIYKYNFIVPPSCLLFLVNDFVICLSLKLWNISSFIFEAILSNLSLL